MPLNLTTPISNDINWQSVLICSHFIAMFGRVGPERMGPRPPPWVPLLNLMVAVSFPPV